MRRLLFAAILLLACGGSGARAQTLYEGCVGDDCLQKQCLSLALCGTGADLSDADDGCIEKSGNSFISTGQSCGTGGGGGGSGVSCPVPSQGDQVLMSNGVASAFWVTVPDCPDGALNWNTSTSAFNCMSVEGPAPSPPLLFVRRTTSADRTSSTLSNDDQLFLPLTCGGITYVVHFVAPVSASSSTPDVQIALAHSSGANLEGQFNCTSLGAASSTVGYSVQSSITAAAPDVTDLQVYSSGKTIIRCDGWIKTGTGCGSTEDLHLMWAQRVTNAAATTMAAGAYLTAQQIL